MVRNILQLIEDNTDRNTTPRESPSILNFIYQLNSSNNVTGSRVGKNEVDFDQAIRAVEEYANKYNNGIIPNNLECIQRVGIDHISKSLTTMR